MMDIKNDPITVTPVTAARLLGIGRTGLFELLRTGVLPSFRLAESG